MPLEDVADILGHATVATTDQHYRQALPAKTVSAIEALAGLMGPPS